ncbi:chemotaxis-specific protein-glutamate methyltransferase CheB [Myxococcus sp. CA051A]|uniref:Protein-glutamate methylesterase/protein-glutamine glutaminase n=1 Tax=Myxococcus llanfairpwllgwyngyllgogerychwyrndrobwllllantysiliogogogochensis TaxID=2590453 RepID=A0A540WJY8_9BACT|nr:MULTISPECIES: chemotaxis-specific protein-glutamate methyltransferase CheB [Myxococcus]NTX02711.1 chemotaxis-specific protein-glutamate methyltransferase CheB [Myxococcus sp. CA040A]NTX11133.1 chemotaxis-specific protein-glutamate methyltransferase CheB [Myxococcus sp. CA056]NTX60401.1 chemotaxis-specific protein-glutamate methyltransferase CheB [Myxococcus sp. CA051A]TQF08774.1 chemotaxis-specific protein-glutamate methyltransferase CheB [Myxococcus llanfairpwllgwyngyllgogerychwyrndrobwllll
MTAVTPVRVLVVDDSAFARKVLRQVLSNAQGIEVVDTARDGLDALEKVAELKPDVLTLDLVMPGLDGLGVLRALDSMPAAPRVVVVSSAGEESELAVSALQAGAVELVHKPSALATDRLYELGAELVEKVRIAARAVPHPPRGVAPAAATSTSPAEVFGPARNLVVVGTSTGGPQALTRLLSALPADFPAPMALALHIPPGYTEAVARRLDSLCALEVREAEDGMEMRPGRVVLARAGQHLKIERHGALTVGRVDRHPVQMPHHPSVDVLFESAARTWGRDTVGLVLTGMGDDGREGARAIRAAGGSILTESESSCVVYGMPRAVDEAGLATASAPLEGMVALLLTQLR